MSKKNNDDNLLKTKIKEFIKGYYLLKFDKTKNIKNEENEKEQISIKERKSISSDNKSIKITESKINNNNNISNINISKTNRKIIGSSSKRINELIKSLSTEHKKLKKNISNSSLKSNNSSKKTEKSLDSKKIEKNKIIPNFMNPSTNILDLNFYDNKQQQNQNNKSNNSFFPNEITSNNISIANSKNSFLNDSIKNLSNKKTNKNLSQYINKKSKIDSNSNTSPNSFGNISQQREILSRYHKNQMKFNYLENDIKNFQLKPELLFNSSLILKNINKSPLYLKKNYLPSESIENKFKVFYNKHKDEFDNYDPNDNNINKYHKRTKSANTRTFEQFYKDEMEHLLKHEKNLKLIKDKYDYFYKNEEYEASLFPYKPEIDKNSKKIMEKKKFYELNQDKIPYEIELSEYKNSLRKIIPQIMENDKQNKIKRYNSVVYKRNKKNLQKNYENKIKNENNINYISNDFKKENQNKKCKTEIKKRNSSKWTDFIRKFDKIKNYINLDDINLYRINVSGNSAWNKNMLNNVFIKNNKENLNLFEELLKN